MTDGWLPRPYTCKEEVCKDEEHAPFFWIRDGSTSIWNLFRLCKEDNAFAMCTVCHDLVGYGSSNTNLFSHLKTKHMHFLVDKIPATYHWTVPALPLSFPKLAQAQRADRLVEFYRLILQWVSDTAISLNSLQHPDFKQALSILDPKFHFGDTKLVKRQLFDFTGGMKKSSVEAVREMSHLVLVVDGWDAPNNDYYVCVDVFYIDASWKLQRQMLSLQQVPGARSTAAILAEYINKVLKDNSVDHLPIYSLVSDTTATMPKLAEELGIKELWFPCMIHQGNLVLKHAMEQVDVIKTLMERVYVVVNFVKTRKKAKKMFTEIQERQIQAWRNGAAKPQLRRGYELPQRAKNVISNFSPRFMVNVDVLDRLMNLELFWEDFFVRWNSENPREPAPEPLSREQFDIIDMILPFLRQFQDKFYQMEAEQRATLSDYYPVIHQLFALASAYSPADSSLFTQLKTKVHELLGKYFADCRSKMEALVACFLDPRHGPYYISTITFHDENGSYTGEVLVNKVSSHIMALCTEMAEAKLRKAASAHTAEVAAAAQVPSAARRSRQAIFASLNTTTENHAATKVYTDVQEELANYGKLLTERDEAPEGIFDMNQQAVDFWREYNDGFPRLAALARLVFSVPVTSASVERNFSATRALLTPSRLSMSSATLEALATIRRRQKDNKKRAASQPIVLE